ncbi:hypothetical protein BC829DRAFT_441013 [Chytridium lagenaria]|nr:hypothetical protein BC829DRAFT_441013 [Chytridium lagenaria]
MFQDEDEAVGAEDLTEGRGEVDDFEEDDIQSEEGDFIVDDDSEEDGGEDEAERIARLKERRRREQKNRGQNYGISNECVPLQTRFSFGMILSLQQLTDIPRVWQDIDDLFGDGSDYAYALHPNQRSQDDLYDDEGAYTGPSEKPSKISDLYEPAEVAARMLTDEDEAIQIRDMPERFQLSGEMNYLSEEDYDRETDYILRTLYSKKLPASLADVRSGVRLVLKFFHENLFEVPFIVAHRKDRLAKAGIDRAQLWSIYDTDLQFQALEAKRKTVRTLLSEVRSLSDAALADDYPDHFLKNSSTLEEISDVVSYLQLHYGVELHRAEETRKRELKRTYRKSAYDEGRGCGLLEFTKFFKIDCKAFALSMLRDSGEFVPEDPYKYLKKRSVGKFENGAFLQIANAEDQGLLIVKIDVDEVALMRDFYKNITNDYTNEYADLWNAERRKIADMCKTILLPFGAKWMREKLISMASDWLAETCRYQMEQKIDVAPFRRDGKADDLDDEEKSDLPRVIRLVSERRRLSRMQQRDFKAEDHKVLKELIKDFRPDVIVVGGWTIETKTRLMPDLAGLLSDLDSENDAHRDRRRRYFVKPDLVMVDDDVCTSCYDFKELREDKLKTAFERAFINVVNFNGVDINEAANPLMKHRSYTLQFVSGLGPRKAQFMIDRVTKSNGKLESRPDLITKKVVSSSVFMNCASFLRIRRRHLPRDAAFDVLDDTRIHPEDYDLARKMAADALDIEESPDSNDLSALVAELMESEPEKLELLMLDEYAKELERRMNEPKYITLSEIKAELMGPDSLREGVVVSCRVQRIFERFVRVVLNSGVEGTIPCSKLPGNPSTPSQILRGQNVELDAREDVVGKDWLKRIGRALRKEDWDFELEEADEPKKQVVVKQQRPQQARSVQHPYWKNFTFQEAVDYLRKTNARKGSVVIRPSTRGNNFLSMTWKIDEDVYQHVEIAESQKENEWSVGKIIAMYLEPMASHFETAVKHVKFKKFSPREMRIPREARSLGSRLQIEPPKLVKADTIVVNPDGFLFRGIKHRSMDDVLNAFKRMESEKAKQSTSASSRASGSSSLPPRPGNLTRGPPSMPPQHMRTGGPPPPHRGGGGDIKVPPGMTRAPPMSIGRPMPMPLPVTASAAAHATASISSHINPVMFARAFARTARLSARSISTFSTSTRRATALGSVVGACLVGTTVYSTAMIKEPVFSDAPKATPTTTIAGTKGGIERTFIAIKPDGTQRALVGEIIGRFEKRGYKLVAIKSLVPSKALAEQHYADLSARPFFKGLVAYMTSGKAPVIAMVWEGKDVIRQGRRIVGATNPLEAAPGTIRGDHCISVGRNIIHASDAFETATEEIGLWFKKEEITLWNFANNEWINSDN